MYIIHLILSVAWKADVLLPFDKGGFLKVLLLKEPSSQDENPGLWHPRASSHSGLPSGSPANYLEGPSLALPSAAPEGKFSCIRCLSPTGGPSISIHNLTIFFLNFYSYSQGFVLKAPGAQVSGGDFAAVLVWVQVLGVNEPRCPRPSVALFLTPLCGLCTFVYFITASFLLLQLFENPISSIDFPQNAYCSPRCDLCL